MSPIALMTYSTFSSQVASWALSPYFVFVSWQSRETYCWHGTCKPYILEKYYRIQLSQLLMSTKGQNSGDVQHGSCICPSSESHKSQTSCPSPPGGACWPCGEMFVLEAQSFSATHRGNQQGAAWKQNPPLKEAVAKPSLSCFLHSLSPMLSPFISHEVWCLILLFGELDSAWNDQQTVTINYSGCLNAASPSCYVYQPPRFSDFVIPCELNFEKSKICFPLLCWQLWST